MEYFWKRHKTYLTVWGEYNMRMVNFPAKLHKVTSLAIKRSWVVVVFLSNDPWRHFRSTGGCPSLLTYEGHLASFIDPRRGWGFRGFRRFSEVSDGHLGITRHTNRSPGSGTVFSVLGWENRRRKGWYIMLSISLCAIGIVVVVVLVILVVVVVLVAIVVVLVVWRYWSPHAVSWRPTCHIQSGALHMSSSYKCHGKHVVFIFISSLVILRIKVNLVHYFWRQPLLKKWKTQMNKMPACSC